MKRRMLDKGGFANVMGQASTFATPAVGMISDGLYGRGDEYGAKNSMSGALTGGTQGAMIGAQYGGVYGAAAGAVIGGGIGYFQQEKINRQAEELRNKKRISQQNAMMSGMGANLGSMRIQDFYGVNGDRGGESTTAYTSSMLQGNRMGGKLKRYALGGMMPQPTEQGQEVPISSQGSAYLGPTHEQGGIPVAQDGMVQNEIEGGEVIAKIQGEDYVFSAAMTNPKTSEPYSVTAGRLLKEQSKYEQLGEERKDDYRLVNAFKSVQQRLMALAQSQERVKQMMQEQQMAEQEAMAQEAQQPENTQSPEQIAQTQQMAQQDPNTQMGGQEPQMRYGGKMRKYSLGGEMGNDPDPKRRMIPNVNMTNNDLNNPKYLNNYAVQNGEQMANDLVNRDSFLLKDKKERLDFLNNTKDSNYGMQFNKLPYKYSQLDDPTIPAAGVTNYNVKDPGLERVPISENVKEPEQKITTNTTGAGTLARRRKQDFSYLLPMASGLMSADKLQTAVEPLATYQSPTYSNLTSNINNARQQVRGFNLGMEQSTSNTSTVTSNKLASLGQSISSVGDIQMKEGQMSSEAANAVKGINAQTEMFNAGVGGKNAVRNASVNNDKVLLRNQILQQAYMNNRGATRDYNAEENDKTRYILSRKGMGATDEEIEKEMIDLYGKEKEPMTLKDIKNIFKKKETKETEAKRYGGMMKKISLSGLSR